MSFKEEVPEKVFQDPNDFYTEDESNRYNQSTGMQKTQEGLTEIAISLIPDSLNSPSMTILDVGCGTGFSLQYLKEKGYFFLKGIDPSREMIKIAKSKKLDVKVASFKELSKIYEKYDFILSISALQWIISNKSEIEIKNIIKKTSKDLKAILKEKGVCVIQFYPDSETVYQTVFNSFKRTFENSEMFIYNSDSLKKRKFFIVLKN
jgi:2-polyprenyl-3-methyl-5-hydroxy-6-metoxy-1,4-benzoquinol methylase